MYSTVNFTICTNSDIDGSTITTGIITNDGYPNYVPNQTCRRKIIAQPGKYIRVFVTDLSIEQPDENGL